MKKQLIIGLVVATIVILIVFIAFSSNAFPSIAPSNVNADSDNDGLSNDREAILGTDPQKSDTDNDGIADGDEVGNGTSPVDYDSDGDGLSDGKEVELKTHPNDIDSDDDGLEDGYEVNSFHTDPLKMDTDGDRLNDKEEETQRTNALVAGSDDDGSSDYDEIYVRRTDPLIPDVSLTLTLQDSETSKLVSGVTVYLDGKVMGSTTQQGTILLNTVSIGKHLVSISYEGFGNIEVGYVDAEKNSNALSLLVNMPNPKLSATLSMREWLSGFNEIGEATVTVANQGQITSKNTMALVMVYDVEDHAVISQDLVRVGSVAIGEMASKKSSQLDTSYWHDEKTIAIIIDGSDYISEINLSTSISSAGSFADDLAREALAYLADHPEIIGKIVAIFLV